MYFSIISELGFYEYVAVFDLDLVGLQVLADWRAKRLAGLDVETTLMQRALYLAAFLEAIRHGGKGVGTNIVRRIDLAIDVVQGDFLTTDIDLFWIVGVDFGCVGHLVPVFFAHDLVFSKSARLSVPGALSVPGRSKIDFWASDS